MTPAPITESALSGAAAFAGRMGFDISRCCEVLLLAPHGAEPGVITSDTSWSLHVETILHDLHARVGAASRTAEVVACYVHTLDPSMTGVWGHPYRVAMTRTEAEEVVLAGGAGWGIAEILSDGQIRCLTAITAFDHAAAVAKRKAAGRPVGCLEAVMPGIDGAFDRPDWRTRYMMYEERPPVFPRRTVPARSDRPYRRQR